MGAKFKDSIYFVLGSFLHCVLSLFLSGVSSIRQIVAGWIFRDKHPCKKAHRIGGCAASIWENRIKTFWKLRLDAGEGLGFKYEDLGILGIYTMESRK